MRAFTSTSRSAWGRVAILALLWMPNLYAEDLQEVPNPVKGGKDSEEDFSESPFTKYGEFQEEEDEAESALFFQYGRFFGVSLGAGFEGVTGNRALLWQGGFPLISAKLHVWFDFNFAMQLEYSTVSHNYDSSTLSNPVDVKMTHLGVGLKYYFDTRNLSAPITFAGPFLLLGAGDYAKSETTVGDRTLENESKFGFNVGGGLEFLISPKKAYFVVEGKLHFVNFSDRLTANFQPDNIPDLTGQFYTFTGNILFTW